MTVTDTAPDPAAPLPPTAVVKAEEHLAELQRAAVAVREAYVEGSTTLGPADVRDAEHAAADAELELERIRRRAALEQDADRRSRLALLADELEALTVPDMVALTTAVDAATTARESAVRRYNASVSAILQRALELEAPAMVDVEPGERTVALTGRNLHAALAAPGARPVGAGDLVLEGRRYVRASITSTGPLVAPFHPVPALTPAELVDEIAAGYAAQDATRAERKAENDEWSEQQRREEVRRAAPWIAARSL